jgi:hypothetical protein
LSLDIFGIDAGELNWKSLSREKIQDEGVVIDEGKQATVFLFGDTSAWRR